MRETAEVATSGSVDAVGDHLSILGLILATVIFFAVASVTVSYALWYCVP